jgi:hypothetical protein
MTTAAATVNVASDLDMKVEQAAMPPAAPSHRPPLPARALHAWRRRLEIRRRGIVRILMRAVNANLKQPEQHTPTAGAWPVNPHNPHAKRGAAVSPVRRQYRKISRCVPLLVKTGFFAVSHSLCTG